MKLLGVLVAMAVFVPGASTSAAVPHFGHVFLIVGENTSDSQVTAKHAPYLTRTLRREGAWLANYRTFTRSSSLGQYIAMVSGQFTRCEANNALPAHCHQAGAEPLRPARRVRADMAHWQESMPCALPPRDAGLRRSTTSTAPITTPRCTSPGLRRPHFWLRPRNKSARRGAGTGSQGHTVFSTLRWPPAPVGDFNLVVPNDCENGHDALRRATLSATSMNSCRARYRGSSPRPAFGTRRRRSS